MPVSGGETGVAQRGERDAENYADGTRVVALIMMGKRADIVLMLPLSLRKCLG